MELRIADDAVASRQVAVNAGFRLAGRVSTWVPSPGRAFDDRLYLIERPAAPQLPDSRRLPDPGTDGGAAGEHDAGGAPAGRVPGELGGELPGAAEFGEGGVRGVQVGEPAGEMVLASFGEAVGDLAEERPDRRRGQPGDLGVVVSGEPDQVAAVCADRVARLVRVR